MVLDRLQLWTLTAPEMAVLIGEMGVLNTNYNHSQNAVFTKHPEAFTEDYFINLLDMRTKWKPAFEKQDLYETRNRLQLPCAGWLPEGV